MKLNNTYVIGVLVQFYEYEMLDEYIHSCIKMLEDIENPENVSFSICISTQQYLEQIDWDYFQDKYGIDFSRAIQYREIELGQFFYQKFNDKLKFKLYCSRRTSSDEFYNIASFRRDLCWNWCNKVDLVVFGETDSMFPSQTLQVLDQLHDAVKGSTPKYIANFADRRLWDNSFAPLHPKYNNVPFIDDEEWQFNSPDSGKGYMSYEQMEEINAIPFEDIKVVAFDEPRFDGRCVAFSSDLLKCGVQIPHSIILHSEDVSLGKIAKKLLGDQFVQYNFSNILHVHNRRHPKKRMGILNETNPSGKCTEKDKGKWWSMLETASKFNYDNLFTQQPFVKSTDVLEQIKFSK